MSNHPVITTNGPKFFKALKSVTMAILDPKEFKDFPLLGCVQCHIFPHTLNMMITERFVVRIAQVDINPDPKLVNKTFYIDFNFAKHISKAPNKHAQELKIQPVFDPQNNKFKNIVNFIENDQTNTDKLTYNYKNYPDVLSLLPKQADHQYKFTVNCSDLLKVLRKIKPQAKSLEYHNVRLNIDKDHQVFLQVYGQDRDFKDVKNDPIQLKTAKVTAVLNKDQRIPHANSIQPYVYCMFFNAERMLRIVNHLNHHNKLKFIVNTPLKPLMFSDQENNFCVIMPLKPM